MLDFNMTKRKEKYLKFNAKIFSKLCTKTRYTKIIFKNQLKYKPDLKNPQTFCEKLNWLKLNYWPDNELAIKCTDKYLVREYLEKNGLDQHLNELYGSWDDARKIDFDKLPNQFILKCTHGCGFNIICEDKSKLDIKKTVKQLNKWLKEDYGTMLAEQHYSKCHKNARIICEKFLGDDIRDYKFFCFNGEPEFMHVSAGCYEKKIRHSYFDKNGNPSTFRRKGRPEIENYKLSTEFEKMKDLSINLAKPFPFVRVDLFEVDGKLYFSELTFSPGACLIKFDPPETDKKLGDLLDIEPLIKEKTYEKK